MLALTVLLLSYAAADPYGLAETALNAWPMVECHDAATTYLVENPVDMQIYKWTMTQPYGGVQTLLDCGARAFDWRPSIVKGKIQMHHGGVTINYEMSTAMDEMIAWANNNSAPEELIVLYVTDCNGANCTSMVQQLLVDKGMQGMVTDCSELKTMTVATAVTRSTLPGGGHILAVFGCVDENYDSTIACSGTESGSQYTCYANSTTKDLPLNRMDTYLKKVSDAGPPSDGRLYQIQALWEETTESVVIGELYGSSLLKDEERSQLNAKLTQHVQDGFFAHVNLLEVNNVCDGGAELMAALREMARRQHHNF